MRHALVTIGIPVGIVNIIISFQAGMSAWVRVNGEETGEFHKKNDLRLQEEWNRSSRHETYQTKYFSSYTQIAEEAQSTQDPRTIIPAHTTNTRQLWSG